MITAIGFVVAAAIGALARAESGRRWNRHEGFPFGTLGVNVVGSFGLGLLWDTAPPVITVVGLAGLGAFTTFSSFARDAVALAEQRRLVLASVYVGVSCAAGVAAAALGVALT
ncbi:MAG: CrcB family protein [Acidimicrobiales bacterium]